MCLTSAILLVGAAAQGELDCFFVFLQLDSGLYPLQRAWCSWQII